MNSIIYTHKETITETGKFGEAQSRETSRSDQIYVLMLCEVSCLRTSKTMTYNYSNQVSLKATKRLNIYEQYYLYPQRNYRGNRKIR